MHVDEEQLQRLVDDEAEAAGDWAREHITSCESCRNRVTQAKVEQDEVFALLGNLDHPPPRADVARIVARGRARNMSWMKRAAGFVVAAALAGAAYAAPGSPLPALAAKIFGSDGKMPSAGAGQMTLPETLPESGVTVAPGPRLVIAFGGNHSAGEVRVAIGEGAEVEVRAIGSGASFTAGENLLAIDNAGSSADFAITIPRLAPLVEIRVGGERVFLKKGVRVVTDRAELRGDEYVITLTAKR